MRYVPLMERSVSLTSGGRSVPELASLAGWAETIGYRSIWLAEVAGPEAFVLATAVAMRTAAASVGVAVVPAFTRTPAVLAMAAGSVSQVLDGRAFRLGIGSSSETIVADWNGIGFHRPLARVRETVEAVRSGLGERGEFQGETVAMHRFRNGSPPVGPVPLYVAALGPKMLELAGSVADGVCLNLMPPQVAARQLELVRRGRHGSERDSTTPFGVMARLQVAVTDTPDAVRDHAREVMLGPYLAQPVYNRFLAWMGYEEEAAAIASGWEARDRAAVHRAVHDRLVDDLIIVGTADRVRDRLDEYQAAGIREAAISVIAPDRVTVEHTLQVLAP